MNYREQLERMAGMPPPAEQGRGMQNMNAPTPVAPVIDTQLFHLDERLDVALKLACELEQKLMRVLRQSPETPRNDKITGAPSTGVPLGDAIASQCERLQGVIRVLSSINERIEL
jgi:hypothetical protein